MNKRGQGGLSMNTIIIAIIGIIVLLLIVTFFTGGMSTVFNKIRGVFGGGTAGYDIDLAKANCQSYCERARLLDTTAAKKDSAYCTRPFSVVVTEGEEAVDQYCYKTDSKVYTPCSGVTCT